MPLDDDDDKTPVTDKVAVHHAEILSAEEDEGEVVTDVTWVPVARDLDTVQAQLLKDELEEAGIPVVITGARIESFLIYPGVENAVLVPRRWSAEAEEIAKDFHERVEAGGEVLICSSCGEEAPEDAEVCPNCGERFEDET